MRTDDLINDPAAINDLDPDPERLDHHERVDQLLVSDNTVMPQNIPDEPRRSTRAPQPSNAGAQSMEYRQRETIRNEGRDWAGDHKHPRAKSVFVRPCIDEHAEAITCITDTKASYSIPQSCREAMSTDPERWMAAMETEMKTLKAKNAWELVKPPPGTNIMGSKWVYDIKWDGEGNRVKDKARLVGKGYTQQLGVDYNETWAAVTRLESVRMTAAIAAKHDLKLWRLDFVGAYLNSLTKEDIYMKQPEGFIEPGFEDHAAKLIHAIYGTMQGGHDWFNTLSTSYDNLGYTASRADPCVRFIKDEGNYTLSDTYTDNAFGASNGDDEIKKKKDEIGAVWEVKDVGELENFLGMRVQQDLEKGTIRFTQRPYWEYVINRISLESVTSRNTPLPVGIVLDANMSPQTDSERREMDDKPYRSILGTVMWDNSQPDLTYLSPYLLLVFRLILE
jgi:Reverse transcriptase (RNA-dependent DNA polymerase)